MSQDINWHERAKSAKLRVRNFVEGAYQEVGGGGEIKKYFSGDGRFLHSFCEGTKEEVDQAVASAKAAFESGSWSGLSVGARKSVLLKLADLIMDNKEELALLECLDVGKPISSALNRDIAWAAGAIRGAANEMDTLTAGFGQDGSYVAQQYRKPVGVVAGIVGWNFPLVLAAQKVGPALAMGNSLVLKPSEFTSLSACRLAELAFEAGVPAGVFNVVNGLGKTVGDALARHMDVDLMTFVGSSATGKQMMVSAGQSNMKRLILECGGKSPFIVFDDCAEDLDFLAEDIVADTAFVNQGQICVSSSRLLVQESIKEKLMPKIIEQAKKLVPSDPLDPATVFGALQSELHVQKVLSYIEKGKEEGADLILGGKQVNKESGGFYVEPTIFDNVDPKAAIAQDEIFGPVLSVFTFKDEEEAIKLANDTTFGLAAYAATRDGARIIRLGQKINAGHFSILATSEPKGGSVSIPRACGHRQSGITPETLEAYTVSTNVSTFL